MYKTRLKKGAEVPCKVCGKYKYVHPSKIGRTKYCSMACRNKDFSFWQRGEKNYRWNGGTCKIGKYLYIKSPNHPYKNSGRYVAEHRLVMEKEIGRYLTSNEEVHHKNGIKDDNRIENLELVIKKIHFGEVDCPYCNHSFKIK